MGIAAIALVIIFWSARQQVEVIYLKLSNGSGIISHRDSQGRLDGDYAGYIYGKIKIKSHFKNGLREGVCVWYYENTGNKRREIHYKKGVPEGAENAYYPNGNLDYSVEWKNNRYVNSQYHYRDNGKMSTYNAFDFSKNENNGFCYVGYDSDGRFHQVLGRVFSSYVYTTCKDSIIQLNNEAQYDCISDLHISVATPPDLVTNVKVLINNDSYTKSDAKRNTILIRNAFTKTGKYEIAIYGNLRTLSGAVVKSDTLRMRIFKQ